MQSTISKRTTGRITKNTLKAKVRLGKSIRSNPIGAEVAAVEDFIRSAGGRRMTAKERHLAQKSGHYSVPRD